MDSGSRSRSSCTARASPLDDRDFKGFLELCDPGFRYKVTAYSPEIRKELSGSTTTEGMETLFTNLPRHNSDHAPLTRHANVYTVKVDGGQAEVVSALQVFRTALDGGATELFAVARLVDTIKLDGGTPKLAPPREDGTRQLGFGSTFRSEPCAIQSQRQESRLFNSRRPRARRSCTRDCARKRACRTSARPGTAARARRSSSSGTLEDGMAAERPAASTCKRRDEFLMCQCAAKSDLTSRSQPSSIRSTDASCRMAPLAGTVQAVRPLTHDVSALECRSMRRANSTPASSWRSRLRRAGHARLFDGEFERPARVLEFVVKKKPGGRLFRMAVLGQGGRSAARAVRAARQGDVPPGPRRNLLCIAGGSGIAGMMSILARRARRAISSGTRDMCSSACAR
jgi:methanesulfonate monooxygenase small subunit